MCALLVLTVNPYLKIQVTQDEGIQPPSKKDFLDPNLQHPARKVWMGRVEKMEWNLLRGADVANPC